MNQQSSFKWRHFQPEIILLCVRWYLRFALIGSSPLNGWQEGTYMGREMGPAGY